MFERVAPSEEQRDAEAREGRSPDQIAALRLAAILVLVDAALTVAVAVSFGATTSMPIIGLVIRVVMAYYLYKLRPRAEALALGLTILGAVVAVLGGVVSFSLVGAIEAIPPLGAAGSLLLLLLGDPRREKRIAAIVVFAVLVALPAILLLVLRLTHVLPPAADLRADLGALRPPARSRAGPSRS